MPLADNRIQTEKPASPEPKAAGGLLDDGDVSLIRCMLEMTSTERLEMLEDLVDGTMALRDGRKTSQ